MRTIYHFNFITMKELSTVAQASKLIRQDLKQHFPNIKFKVRSENYSMGDSITVEYCNGVPASEVENVINKYEYGHFDGMTDMYEYSNRQDFPQTKYLFVNREVSDENKEKVRQEIMKDYGIDDWNDQEIFNRFNTWPQNLLSRNMKDRSFV